MNQSLKKLLPTPALRRFAKMGVLTAGFCGLMVPALPVLADVSVNIQIDPAPPPPRHEVMVERERPGPDYVWIAGYWDGAPGHYVWTAGHWDRPPHGHGHWVAPAWVKDSNGHYHQVRGEWRD
jgi:hypothetical protein